MSLNIAIDYHSTGTYNVIRRARGPVSGGVYAQPPIISLAVLASNVDYIGDTLIVPGHGLSSGAGPVYASTDDALPGGISASPVPLWIARVDDDRIALAADRAAARLGAPIVDIADRGTGTLSLGSRFAVRASVQPTDGHELRDLVEGQRVENTYLVLTREQLHNGEGDWEPDLLEIDDETYRVDKCQRWVHWGERHYESIVSRVDVP
jgi:hypothetical protein